MRSFEFENVRDRCVSKLHVTEEFPFDEKTCVWKVAGKLFALADIDAFDGVTLKCDPEYAVELREQYAGIIGGYHANKKHWNTVQAYEDVPQALVLNLIDHSYERVVAGFSQKQRRALGFLDH